VELQTEAVSQCPELLRGKRPSVETDTAEGGKSQSRQQTTGKW